VPARLLAGGFREVLTMAPAPPIREQLWSCVTEVERRYRFAESFLRSSKVGSRLDVQIDYVVAEDSLAQNVREFDAVRQDINDLLEPLGYQQWVSVVFTGDRKWAV
jgi:predicted Co/Zn/Cd cation transporter (cation efflux family)